MVQANNFINLSQAAKLVPGRPHSATVWRWCRKGIAARTGERIHLQHVRIGGKIFVRENDLDRFFEAVAEADCSHFDKPKPATPPKASNAQRDASRRHADTVLKRAGIL